MTKSCSNSAYKAVLGAVLALTRIRLSPRASSLLDRIWELNIFNPGRSGSCSSWQCCRTQLVLQLCQLHHLLTRLGLEDNHRQSCSISRWSRCLIQSRARRRGRLARHLAAIWRPYASVGPTRQVVGVVMDATTPRTHSAPIHSLPSSLSRVSVRRKRPRHCRRELRKLVASSSLRLASPLSISKSASSSSIFSTPRLGEISPRWATFREFLVVEFTAVVTPIPANLAVAPSLLPFFPLSRVKVYLGLGVSSRHAIPALVPPSRGNTAATPPCSPPTSTSHH